MKRDPHLNIPSHAKSGMPGDGHGLPNAFFPKTDPIKVLIIEDEEAHFQLMMRAIRKKLPEISVRHGQSAAECLEELDDIKPDIILVDYLLPDMTGIQFLTAVKQMGLDIPVVMITGQGDEGVAVRAMKLGAQDYLIKNAEFFSLLPSVIEQVVRERSLQRNLSKISRLNDLLLDSLPYPAMMVRQDRIVLAANRVAREMGARAGQFCWQSFEHISGPRKTRKSETKCSFCRVNEMLLQKKAINTPELNMRGRICNIWWIPVDRDVFLHYAIDNTDRKMTEYKMRVSSRFLEIANRHEDKRSLLQDFVRELKNITGCCAAAAWVLNDKGDEPLIVSNGCDPQMEGLDSIEQQDFRSTALLSVQLEGRTLGSVFLADTGDGMLPPEKIELAQIAAKKLAPAVERIRSKELLKKSERTLRFLSEKLMNAQEEERKKISRELHDSVGGSLCAIRLSLSNILQGKLERKPLQKIQSLIKSTIDEVRRIMVDLRPSFLDELGIVASLASICAQFSEIHPGIDIEQRMAIEENDVPEPLKIVILRIVQESFNNIAKYSQAKKVTLDLVKNKDVIRLSVNDNGIGFNVNSAGHGKDFGTGIGLISMKERTELSGGNFALTSREGQGTEIAASWPL